MASLSPALDQMGGKQTARPFSRINSFKRDWDDQAENDVKSSSAQDISWSSSPDMQVCSVPLSRIVLTILRVRRKGSIVAPQSHPIPSLPTDAEKEAIKLRRRNAILAALAANSATSSNTTPSLPTLKEGIKSRASPAQLVCLSPEQQPSALPSLPSLPEQPYTYNPKKREMPWDESHSFVRLQIQRVSLTEFQSG
jgi:hypothetical protein